MSQQLVKITALFKSISQCAEIFSRADNIELTVANRQLASMPSTEPATIFAPDLLSESERRSLDQKLVIATQSLLRDKIEGCIEELDELGVTVDASIYALFTEELLEEE